MALTCRPAAIIFDMDGLLLDSERVTRAVLQAVAADMGYGVDDALFATLIGGAADTNRAQLQAAFGADFDYAALRDGYHNRRRALYGDRLPLKPGAVAAVAAAARLGPVAVATSTGAHARAMLAAVDILPLLTTLVTRDDVANGKPAPDLYIEAARRLGAMPATALALEDSHNGVRAAHAAGVPVIMIPDLLPPTDEMRALALAVAPDLATVTGWLQTV